MGNTIFGNEPNLVNRLLHDVIPDESVARQAAELSTMSTAEYFHRDHIMQRENVDFQQLIADFQKTKPLSDEELDRKELEKFIFDRLPIIDANKEAIAVLFESAITVETFLLLTVEDFREMGVQMGPRKHFLQMIEQENLRRQDLTARSDVDALAEDHRSITARHHSDSAAVPRLNFSSLQQTAGVPLPISNPSENHHRDEVRDAESEVVTENSKSNNNNNDDVDTQSSAVSAFAGDRDAFHSAISSQDVIKIRSFLSDNDGTELLLAKDADGRIVLHIACSSQLSKGLLQLLLDAAVEHRIIRRMLEEKNNDGLTCLHCACSWNLSTDSFCLLLEYSLKHTNIGRILEGKTNVGSTCLHLACEYNFSIDSLRLLLEYLYKHVDVKKVLEAKNNDGATCLHRACDWSLSTDSLRLLLGYLSNHTDIKKMFEKKDIKGQTCLHSACASKLSPNSLRLLLEYLSKHTDIKKMFEEKANNGWTYLHMACANDFSIDSLRLLLEYLSKYSEINKMLEEKNNYGATCLHYACAFKISSDSFRVLVSFFPSNESLQLILSSKDVNGQTPIDVAESDEYKQLLEDPDCWRTCRYWVLCNYQTTFLNSLYPNSTEKTLKALTELNKSYADDETLKKAIADLEAK